MRTISVWVKEVGKEGRIEVVNNDIATIQRLVGGYVEQVLDMRAGLAWLVNADASPMGLPRNMPIVGRSGVHALLGTVVAVGIRDSQWRSLQEKHLRLCRVNERHAWPVGTELKGATP